MLVLLPPSETKRDGGTRRRLDLDRLSFPELGEPRRQVLDAVERMSCDPQDAAKRLGLGPRNAHEAERNAVLTSAPTMPAIDRYTGVLYDALDASSLDSAARAFAARHVVIHSALFGVIGAGDRIPSYRLSHDTRLPDLRLKAHWRGPVADVLAARRGVILDLRSEGYVELGPVPSRSGSAFVRVVTEDGDGRTRALNHFNKRAKGEFVRALLIERPRLRTLDDVEAWAAGAGFSLSRSNGSGELELIV